MTMDEQALGLVADIGGTNTRLGRADRLGVVTSSVVTRSNDDFSCFEDMVIDYLADQNAPDRVVVAVAGPVNGTRARLTNRDWAFHALSLGDAIGARHAHLINDLEALGASVPGVPSDCVEPLHAGAALGKEGQALVVGLGTGFNVSPVDTQSGVVFSCEQGHASLPSSVKQLLDECMNDSFAFQTVEDLFSGPGFLNLAQRLGADVQAAWEIEKSEDPRARDSIDVMTQALAVLLRELAYTYFPRAGVFLNGSLAQLLVAPDRRDKVLALLHEDTQFDGQFAQIPVFRFTSGTVGLRGCAAVLQRLSRE